MLGFNWLQRLRKRRRKLAQGDLNIDQRLAQIEGLELAKSLDENLAMLKEITCNSSDVKFRRFFAPGKVPMALVFIEGLSNSSLLQLIIQSLSMELLQANAQLPKRATDYTPDFLKKTIPIEDVRVAKSFSEVTDSISYGDTVLLIDGSNWATLLSIKQWPTRAVAEPETETVIRGPRDGFVEDIRINTSLIRRRIKTPDLRFESLTIGKLTKTQVSFAYIQGLVKEGLVSEVRSRLKKIEIDGILESGYVEEFIEDSYLTILPLVLRTERPDRVCGSLLEGRVAILTDTTPFVLVVPIAINDMLMAPDDYYEKVPLGSTLRILRLVSFVVAMLLPGIYVAIVNFHMELLPTSLLLNITATREGVPFPVVVEVLIMEALFEVLREAGVRLPRVVGPAISIVGALILGDAAIRASIVSPAVVIIVALTAIASFTVPVFSLGITGRLLRFVFVVLGATFGLFGIQFGLLLLIVHLCSLRSFGVPVTAPYAPLILRDLKDSFVRWWWWGLTTRPQLEGGRNPRRQPKKKNSAGQPKKGEQKNDSRKN